MPKDSNLKNKKDLAKIKKLFLERFADAKSELRFASNYELIVSVMLSAQCTDKRVNLITPALFETYPSVRDLARARPASVAEIIHSCSFFNAKAENLVKMARLVVERHGGEVPLDEKALLALPGVGQKTAHVVLIEAKGANVMAVDTHVFRVAHRLGLATAKTPAGTDEELTALFRTDLARLHQAMIWFGRLICEARKPKCEECFLREFCDFYGREGGAK